MNSGSSEFASHWPLVAVCSVGVGIGVASLPFYTQGLFIEKWIADFGWSRAEASLGILGSTFALAAVSPFVGTAVDRYGMVRPIAAALTGLSLSFILLALFVDSVASFVGLSILMALLGCASSPLAYSRAINAVFDRQRGLALGITLSGTGVTAAVAPPIVAELIGMYGWRGAYLILASFTAAASMAIVLVLSRLQVSGITEQIGSQMVRIKPSQEFGSKIFWMLLAAVFLFSLGFGGLIVHFVPILLELGVEGSDAARTAAVIGVAVILGRIAVGALIDRLFAPRVAATVISLCLCGTLILATLGGGFAVPAAFVIGFAIGAEVDLIGYLVARYFGMAAYGRHYGIQYAAFLVGAGASPVLVGGIRDATGDYIASLFTAAAILALSAMLFLMFPKFEQAKDRPDK